MKITNVASVRFGRAFTPAEKKEADSIREKAMELLGNKKIILIVPEQSLPIDVKGNNGIGQLNSKSSFDFVDFMKSYMGINTLKVLPQGELGIPESGLYCNYDASALTLGSHTINLNELASDEMDNILSKETLNKVFDKSKETGKVGTANFENVIGKESMQSVALKEAFENFQKSDSPVIKELKKEFEIYKAENSFLEKSAFYEILSEEHKSADFANWKNDIDKNLFNTELVADDVRNKRIAEIKSKHASDVDFVYFKQFLAEKNLAKSKANLNSKGVRLMGDCLIGFSNDSIWAYPKAFEHANICSSEWNLRALNYKEILQEGSESNKLFKLKVSQFAKRYDDIRFDVGWGYVDPILYPIEGNEEALKGRYIFDQKAGGYKVEGSLKDDVLKIIEKTVKEVKGKDYNLDNLIYEIEAGPKEFSVFDWNKNELIEAFKNRTIVQSTAYIGDGYATVDFMENTMKVPRKNYVYMSGNHDHIALSALARKIDNDGMLKANGDDINLIYENQIRPLAKGLKISEAEVRKSPESFVKSKFSYSFLAENVKLFFMDVFGRSEQFDSQRKNTAKNYRQMIPHNYEEAMHEALQNNKGLNIMETLALAMKGKNLDKSNNEVYNKLLEFSNILKEKESRTSEKNEIFGESVKEKTTKSRKPYFAGGLALAGLLLAGGMVYFKNRNSNPKDSKSG